MTGYGAGVYGGGLYGGAPGVALLPRELVGAVVAVEVAWAADLTDLDGSGWTWTDITADVRQADGLALSLGRNDEASTSQPANLSLTLDNSAGSYSLGGQSPNWPNVRRNVPVRVRVDPGPGSYSTVFQGYAVGFTPGWDSAGGTIPVAKLEAAGVLRRIGQGSDPLRSALFRYLTLVEPPLEYWPLEEEKTATQGTSWTAGGPASFVPIVQTLLLYGKVGWGADTDNPATARAVQVSAGGSIFCPVRSGLLGGSYAAISWSMRYTGGSGAFVRMPTTVGTTINATFFADGSVELYEGVTLRLSWNLSDPVHWDNVWHHYVLVINGASWTIYVDGVAKDTSSATVGLMPTELQFTSVPDPGGTEDPISVAHAAVFASAPDVTDLAAAASAHVGELATDRITRLCAQEAVDVDIVGTTPSALGPQLPVSFLALLRECEAVDQGVLYDGVGPGLRYVCRSDRENAAVDLVLDADQLAAPFGPTDDDQRTRNRVTASAGGSKATFEDTDGPMGTGVIGVYDSSVTVNLDDAGEAIHYAGWAVHLGTREGYRYPVLTLDMRATPTLVASVLAVEPSSRVTLENVGATLAAMPADDVDLLVEGMAMALSPYGWTVTLKCSPFGPWVVGTVASPTGDTDTDLVRLDTDGSTLSAGAALGATSISVATTSGPLWTTTSDDFPLVLDVGGVRVRVTACSDGTSPQVMTVDALPIARSLGAPVKVWDPPALGL